jgi:hypothetical protein
MRIPKLPILQLAQLQILSTSTYVMTTPKLPQRETERERSTEQYSCICERRRAYLVPASDMVETSLEPHSHPRFLDNTHSPNLSWTLHFDPPPLVCSSVCVCVCVLWDLRIGCCVYTILGCALFGFVNWVFRVHNSGLRSCGCCVCERSEQCLPPAVMSVRRQARGWSGDACVRRAGNARNSGWKKPSAILRNSNSSPLRNCVVLDCSARQLCVGPRVVTCIIYPAWTKPLRILAAHLT